MNRVLIVDDSEIIAELVKMQLTEKGFLVDWAPDVMTANKLIKERRPDLILCDVQLPDVNGMEFCGILKSKPETASIPIIICSAAEKDHESILKGFSHGADDYIAKPFQVDELAARITAVLKRVEEGARQEVFRQQTVAAQQRKAVEATRAAAAPAAPAAVLLTPRQQLTGLLFEPGAFLGHVKLGDSLPIAGAVVGAAAAAILLHSPAAGGVRVLPAAFMGVAWLGGAFLLHFALTLLQARLVLKDVLAALGLAWLPLLVNAVLSMLYSWANPEMSDFIAGPGLFLDAHKSNALALAAARHLGLFELWSVALAVALLSHHARLPRARVAGLVCGLWLIGVAAHAAIRQLAG